MSTEVLEKPKLLQAIEIVLANPEDIKNESIQLYENIKKIQPQQKRI